MPATPVYGIPYLASTDAPDIAALGEGIAEATETQLQRLDNVNGINNVTGTASTTSTSFGNLPATSSFSFTKRSSSSRLVVELHLTAFCTGTASALEVAVQINGVDYTIAGTTYNTLLSHQQISGVHPTVAPGLAAGTYTIQARWRRASGTGTFNVDGADRISIVAREV